MNGTPSSRQRSSQLAGGVERELAGLDDAGSGDEEEGSV